MSRSSPISISGCPAECGRRLGRLQKSVLQARIEATRGIQRRQGIAEADLSRRVAAFAERLRKATPHWLEEAEAMAAAAEVPVADVLLLNCLPADFFPPTPGNCTSFLAIGPQRCRLAKIRDYRNGVQSLHSQAQDGQAAFQAGRDIGNLGVAHMINQFAVAGACNTGSHTRRVGLEPRFDDCHVLRYMAEKAESVDQIPALYRKLVEADAPGGAGPGRGGLYLFVDPTRGLLLECVENDWEATFFEQGTHAVSNHFLSPRACTWWSQPPNENTLRRLARIRELLPEDADQAEASTLFAITRDRAGAPDCLCNDDAQHPWMTVSAQIHDIDRDAPADSASYVCCGNTLHSLYVRLPLAARHVPRPFVDGGFYREADRLYRAHRCDNYLAGLQREFESDAASTGARAAWPENAWQAWDRLRQAT